MDNKFIRIKSWTPENQERGMDWQWGAKYVGTDEKFLITQDWADMPTFYGVWDHHRGLDCLVMKCDVEEIN